MPRFRGVFACLVSAEVQYLLWVGRILISICRAFGGVIVKKKNRLTGSWRLVACID